LLFLRAVLQLRGAPPPKVWMLLPLLAVFLASTLLLDQRGPRIIVVNALLALQEGLVLWALLRQGGIAIGRGRHILAASTLLLLLMFAFRSLAIALGWLPATPVVVGGLLPTVTYLVTYLAVVFIAFGFVLVATELAAHQSHRLAMEDAIELARCLSRDSADHATALARFQAVREPLALRALETGLRRMEWFENVAEHALLEPHQFAYALLTSSGRLDPDELRRRDPQLMQIFSVAAR